MPFLPGFGHFQGMKRKLGNWPNIRECSWIFSSEIVSFICGHDNAIQRQNVCFLVLRLFEHQAESGTFRQHQAFHAGK